MTSANGPLTASGSNDGPDDDVDDDSVVPPFRDWPDPARTAVFIGVGVLVLLLALVAVCLYVARMPLPQTSGTLEVPGLDAEVRVLRDDHGIPRIQASTRHDLMLAQGYVHAQDRFFEMDMRRHYTAGRLSEIFGEATLDSDRFVRTLGWRRVAQQEVGLVSPATRVMLQDYADGVNAYLAEHGTSDLAVEYTLLSIRGDEYTPQPWTPTDSLAWLKAMAWDLRGNVDDEIARALIGVDHTAEQVAELYPRPDLRARPPIVQQGALTGDVFDPDGPSGDGLNNRPAFGVDHVEALGAVADVLAAVPSPFGRGDALGSNSWVLGGEHTDTGLPILANDPHLGVSLPGVWSQVGLQCVPVSDECDLDVAGFGFAGVPGVVIGHNADIAWGFTNQGPDVTDLYLERLDRGRWRHGGQWRTLQTRREVIQVAGREDVVLDVRSTDHGPLVSDVDAQLSSVGANAAVQDGRLGYAVSLAWTGLVPTATADAILAMNTASDWDEFRAAAAQFAVPAQNLVYADRTGRIGYQATGLIPLRARGHDGTVPVPGWRKRFDWSGRYVPTRALPHVLDPETGVIVTANQTVIDPARYRFDLGRDVDQGYRAQRIRDLLDGRTWSVADTARLQLDDHNPMAPVLVPHLLALDGLDDDPYLASALDLLRDWDFRQTADSGAAAYFNAVWTNLLRLTFHDEIRESLRPDGGQRWFAVVTRLLAAPDASWWDDRHTEDVVETRDDVLAAAVRDARDQLTREQSPRTEGWRWGTGHRLDLRHQALGDSGIGLVERLVNRGAWEVGGGTSAVDASAWQADRGFTVTSAASMRMVVSLADPDDSRWVSMTGVSGHPMSPHYVDQTHLWARGETLPWAFTPEAVEEAARDELTLLPGGD